MTFFVSVSKGSKSSSTPAKELGEFEVDAQTTIGALKKQIHAANKKYYPSRQELYVLEDGQKVKFKDSDASLSSLDIDENTELLMKDLGPQVGWSTVFYVEYGGPILIHGAAYLYNAATVTFFQQVLFLCILGHYVKRELETAFVHRFSNGTMPLRNIFKNSAHYWLLGSLLPCLFLYSPAFTPSAWGQQYMWLFVGLFVLAEVGNFRAHWVLRQLRPPGSRKYGNPRGGMFEYVACANYFWEIVAWTSLAVACNHWSLHVFLVVSTGQITQWALKKHKNLKQKFPVPKGRKALFPFIL